MLANTIDQDSSLAIEVVHDAIEFLHHAAIDLGLAIAIHLSLNDILDTVFFCKYVYSPIGCALGYFCLITFLLQILAC